MTKQITVKTDNLTDSAAPLYFQYDGQCNTQPAYIEIDPRGDEITISADYSGETGGGISGEVWHNLVQQISCPAGILGSALIAHMESDDFKKDVLELCDGYEDVHNGSNWVGKWHEGVEMAVQGMEYALHDIECAEIYTGEEWIEEDLSFIDEDGNPCHEYQASSGKYGDIDINSENLEILVDEAEGYIDENVQMVFGLEAAFESIIEEME